MRPGRIRKAAIVLKTATLSKFRSALLSGLPSHKARQAPPNATAVYVRHRPETTLLCQIIQEYWPEVQAELANHGRFLPAYVTKEFDEYLKCGRLEYGFFGYDSDIPTALTTGLNVNKVN